MNVVVIGFTARAGELCKRVVDGLRKEGHTCTGYLSPKFLEEETEQMKWYQTDLKGWVKQHVHCVDGMLFIGATGIAIRGIAPFIENKTKDPAIVVMDEFARYVIPLLSGHIGGANELAIMVSELALAVPVITTATDLNGMFAVDVFARKNQMKLSSMERAKAVSAALLNGEEVGWFSEFLLEGVLPKGLKEEVVKTENIYLTIKEKIESNQFEQIGVLRLVPQIVTLGIGCRKGVSYETILHALEQVCRDFNIDEASIQSIASIDLKKEEEGICRLAKERNLLFETFSSEELKEVEGVSSSEFVKTITGVDNVCERAALLAVKRRGLSGKILVPKQIHDKVTISLVVQEWKGKL